MITKYQRYMDRQTVSPDLHRRLLAMEQEQKKVVQPVRWQRWAALAAALALAAGIGLFTRRNLDASSTLSTAPTAESAVAEDQAVDTAVMPAEESAESGSTESESADFGTEAAKGAVDTEEAAVESAADTALPPEAESLSQYATDYLGDAPSVVHIAAGMTYPAGWQYDHVELQTQQQPYGLDIHLTGNGDTDFQTNADTAFALIGNLDVVRFVDSAGTVLAEYNR